MEIKDQFTSEEWKTLEFGVLWAFQSVLHADGKVSAGQLDAFRKISVKADTFGSELAAALFKDIKVDARNIVESYNRDSRLIEYGLKDMNSLLDRKVEEKEAKRFKKAVLAAGTYLAHASSGYFEANITDEEMEMIDKMAEIMNITENDLRKSPTIQEILSELV